MITFKEFLLLENYIKLDDAIGVAPDVVKSTLSKLQSFIVDNAVVKVDNKVLFKPYNGRKNSATVFKTSLDNIKSFAKFFNEDVIMVDKNHEGFYHLLNGYMLKFVKTGLLSLKTSGSNKTELQEVAVLLYLDNDLKRLDNYVPSKNLNVKNPRVVEDTLTFLRNNKDWDESTSSCAFLIAKQFPKYKQYELHRGSDLFNEIKRKGSKLSGINADKWNPSDIFLIKNSSNVLKMINDIDNIMDYNNYISQFDDVIGISLKKGEREALHGSISLDNVIKTSALGQKLNINDDFDIIKENLKLQLNQIKSSPMADLVFLSKTVSKNINDNIDNLNPSSSNFKKSLPLGIEFLTRICNNIDKTNETIKYAYLTAVSKHPLSCSYYKADDGHIKLFNNKNNFDFKLEKIIIPLNGDTNVIFLLSINNEPIKLQLRSKGSKPQFMVIKTNLPKVNIENIRNFK